MANAEEITLEETAAKTGVTIRNIKYWTALYELEVRREGRRNFYSPRTVEILRAIGELAELQLYTTNLVRWLVDAAYGRASLADERARRYAARRKDLSEALKFALPPAPAGIEAAPRSETPRPTPRVPLPAAPSAVPFRNRGRNDDDALL